MDASQNHSPKAKTKLEILRQADGVVWEGPGTEYSSEHVCPNIELWLLSGYTKKFVILNLFVMEFQFQQKHNYEFSSSIFDQS